MVWYNTLTTRLIHKEKFGKHLDGFPVSAISSVMAFLLSETAAWILEIGRVTMAPCLAKTSTVSDGEPINQSDHTVSLVEFQF